MKRPIISVATTVYNGERCIEKFVDDMRRILKTIDCTWEIILVDDGSFDNSVALCRSIVEADSHTTLVELSKNFGQEAALLEAMRQASGDFIFLIDLDLEVSPEILLEMLDMLRREEPTVDVIYGVQKSRQGTAQHKLLGSLFYTVFNKLSDVTIPHEVLTVRLMTRRYVDALLLHNERTIALAGLFAVTGFEQRALPVEKSYKGYTSYNFVKRVAIFLRYLINFSTVPANTITVTGLLTAMLAAIYAIYVFGTYWFTDNPVEGWTTLTLLVLFFNGILLTSVGVCAAYLAFIFQEVKGRPLTIVKEIHNGRHPKRPSVPIPSMETPPCPRETKVRLAP